MEMKKVLAGWSKDLPRLQRRAQISGFIYRQESERSLEKGCMSHDAYVEVYGSEESSPKKDNEKSDDK